MFVHPFRFVHSNVNCQYDGIWRDLCEVIKVKLGHEGGVPIMGLALLCNGKVCLSLHALTTLFLSSPPGIQAINLSGSGYTDKSLDISSLMTTMKSLGLSCLWSFGFLSELDSMCPILLPFHSFDSKDTYTH